MAERRLSLAHTTIMRWVQRYAPEFEKRWNRFARKGGGSWRVDEVYVKIKGRWAYLYRAVDKAGKTVDFLLRAERFIAAVKALFRRAFASQGRLPQALHQAARELLAQHRGAARTRIRSSKLFVNLVEQDHRSIGLVWVPCSGSRESDMRPSLSPAWTSCTGSGSVNSRSANLEPLGQVRPKSGARCSLLVPNQIANPIPRPSPKFAAQPVTASPRLFSRRACLVATGVASFSQIAAHSQAAGPVYRRVVVDDAWTGADIRFDAVIVDDIVYVGYLNAERCLTLAAVDLTNNLVTRTSLSGPLPGYDAHREVRIFADRFGVLHICGGMHADPLIYARLSIGAPLGSLSIANRMTGSGEDAVTYPRFATMPNGDVLFGYRNGRSGAGETRFKIFDGASWRDPSDRPVLGEHHGRHHSSAYPFDPQFSPDGRLSLAWNWRRNADVATNYFIGFAQTSDLQTWTDVNGRSLDLPISETSTAVVDAVNEGSGLMGPPRLGFDPDGRPLLTYLKFDENGSTELYLAAPQAGEWGIEKLTAWNYKWALSGYGTTRPEISTNPITPNRRGGYALRYYHVVHGQGELELDSNFVITGDRKPTAPRSADPFHEEVPKGFRLRQSAIPGGEKGRALLRWITQFADGDARPDCTDARPLGCAPPSRPIALLIRD